VAAARHAMNARSFCRFAITSKSWRRLATIGLVLLMSVPAKADSDGAAKSRQQWYRDLTQRHDRARSSLTDTDAALARIEAWLQTPAITERELAATQAAAVAERDRLQQAIRELTATLASAPDDLVAALRAAETDRTSLQTDVANLQRELADTSSGRKSLSAAIPLDGLESQPFLLTGDRIAPFRRPDFEAEATKVRLPDRRIVQRLRFSRTADAGAIAAAIEPGGVLATLVNAP